MMMKNAIVTGASGGIGSAIIRKFAQNGINSWACASKRTEEFEEKIRLYEREYGVWIKPVYFDLLDDEETKKVVQGILHEKKIIDIMVNNAGISPRRFLLMSSMEDIRRVMEINFLAPLLMTQLVSRTMIKEKKGCIINIASVSGCIYSDEGSVAYGSSKAALIQATKTLAKELSHYNIRVNAVSPGFIETKMWNDRQEDMINKGMERSVLKRMGTPEEVANVVYFLSSEEASYLTGVNIVCQG